MTHEQLLIGLSGVVILGVLAQWLASRMRVPAILTLLLFGFLAGPVPQYFLGFKLIDPDRMLGPLIYPVVSLSVAVILFEGGLTLNVAELRQVGGVVRNLVTVGALATWVVAMLAGRFVLGLQWPLAVLLGAVLVVTGPTVIGPLLRHVKPVGRVGPILKWEGIVIDPIGATLALLVFQAIDVRGVSHLAVVLGLSVVKTIAFGGLIGAAAAAVLVVAFRRFWVPDYLQNPVTLMMVVAAFTGANLLQHEAGLLAVTVMGVALANQRFVPFKHILEFKESLTVLLVSALFVLLGSRLEVRQFEGFGWRTAGFVAVLMLVARPAAVLASSRGSTLTWRERAFLSWIAPRGVVAAAVSSVFALRLRGAGFEQAERLVPVTFALIVATVTLNGLTASWLARRLGLAKGEGGGFLIAGASEAARGIAKVLKDGGQQVVLVDTGQPNVAAAQAAGLEAYPLSINSELVLERIEGTGISRLLAMTPNGEVNSLAALHFSRLFGRSRVYQLSPEGRPEPAEGRHGEKVSQELRGRLLFWPEMSYPALAARVAMGARFTTTRFTPRFTFDDFRAAHGEAGEGFIPLFLVTEAGEWVVMTADELPTPRPGQALVSLVSAAADASDGGPSAGDQADAVEDEFAAEAHDEAAIDGRRRVE